MVQINNPVLLASGDRTGDAGQQSPTRAIHFCLEWSEVLTKQELEFVIVLLQLPWRMAPKQQSELDRVFEKCRRVAAADVD
jgi:hypothetical protein